ncbi:histidine phosphatase family protein [Telmatospirillum sp. J64-1]|uniref:histidine phosphatase family protein n=1 Tax=Telmatospirillum sp. J64-1 TaxID=2502183 RepID=UPI00115EBBAB|nr:histidine phosphatase family protein [Telmatospirillum sp. J64-1]
MQPRFGLPLMPFYFLRHGVTDHNLARRIMGQLDIPLNERGRDQARAAAELLVGRGIGRIIASPLSRAVETAGLVASVLGVEVVVVEELKERGWGVIEGSSITARPHDILPRGAEDVTLFTQRTIAALAGEIGEGAPVLVVAHSGTCRALRRHLGLERVEGRVPNCIPLRFEPRRTGGWREYSIRGTSRVMRPEEKPEN